MAGTHPTALAGSSSSDAGGKKQDLPRNPAMVGGKERTEQAPVSALFRPLDLPEQSGYCSHCGGCCEIASGFPSFPRATSLPLRWQQLFGAGLGEGHRFCAFLWEFDASGRSVCAIHPWRPAPCRAFAEDECAFLKNDLNKHPPYRPQDFSMACQRLSRLVDRR